VGKERFNVVAPVAAAWPLAGFVTATGGVVTESLIAMVWLADAATIRQSHLGAGARAAITAHDVELARAIIASGQSRRSDGQTASRQQGN